MRRREFIATVGGAGCSFSLGIARARLHRGTDRSLQNRLPATAPFSEFVEEGGLLNYGATFARMFHDAAAHYVDRILRGASLADLPIEQSTKFEFCINLRLQEHSG
jgi:putative tryptophan/tyrosine transport system substrate-binding protein